MRRVSGLIRVSHSPYGPASGASGDQNQITSHRFTQFMWSIVGKSYRISKNSI